VWDQLDKGHSVKEIERDLKALGYSEPNVKEAMKIVKQYHKHKIVTHHTNQNFNIMSNYLVFFLIIFMLIAIPILFNSGMGRTIFFEAIVVLVKTLIYAAIFYLIATMTDYSKVQSWHKCFFGTFVIVLCSLIPTPFFRFAALGISTVVIFIIIANLNIKQASAFFVFIVAAELFFGIGVASADVHFDVIGYNPGELGLASRVYCTQLEAGDIYERGYVSTVNGEQYDFCTDQKRLSSKYEVTNCAGEDCYLVEYSCVFFERNTGLYDCEQGCELGACLSHAP